jgi:hypothetical protein
MSQELKYLGAAATRTTNATAAAELCRMQILAAKGCAQVEICGVGGWAPMYIARCARTAWMKEHI